MTLIYRKLDTDSRNIPSLATLPDTPNRPFEFEPLTIVVRKEGTQYFVEAIGPFGGRLESPTEMPDSSADSDAMGKAIFPGNIATLFQELITKTKKAGQGIRIQLDFRGEAKSYAIWPWESMRLNGEYLLASPHISIARTISSHRPALPFGDTEQPYRLLFLMTCPRDIPGENKGQIPDIKDSIEKDLTFIRKALSTLEQDGLLEITVLKDREATLANLQNELKKENYQALFVSGHGMYGNRQDAIEKGEKWTTGDDGALVFDDGTGVAHQVFGADLQKDLVDSSVRLVFINTMHTAYGASPQGEGVAEMLLEAGIPAVIAFQDQVYTHWASEFAGEFFTTLTHLNSLELALLAGRKAILEKDKKHWNYPILFTRFLEGAKVFSGEIGGKISAFVNADGEVEIVEQKQNESEVDIFNRQLKSLNGLLQDVDDLEARTQVQNQILNATRQLQKDADKAINMLSDSTMMAVGAIKKQQAIEVQQAAKTKADQTAKEARELLGKRKQIERTVVLLLGVIMVAVVGILASFLDEKAELGVLGLPLPVVLWSFIGGVGATLYAFVGTQKYTQTEPLRLDWLIGRPIVGIIMGSVVYLAVAASLTAVGSAPVDAVIADVPAEAVVGDGPVDSSENTPKPYLLWALSFIGGFSDKFAILLFDNLVGKFTTGQKKEDDDD